MRVVLIAGPDAGHAFPVMALAERFRSAGDEVVVLTGERWWQAGRAAGLDMRALPGLEPRPEDDDADAGQRIHGRAAHMSTQVLPVLTDLAPDLVVADVLTAGGGLAAERCGIPWVELSPHPLYRPSRSLPPLGSGLTPGSGVRGRMRDVLMRRLTARSVRAGTAQRSAARVSLGLPAVDPGPARRLIATIPALEVPRVDWPSEARLVGALLWEPTDTVLDPPPGDEPLVVVAPSTAATGEASTVDVAVEAAARARAAGLPVRVAISALDAPGVVLPPWAVAGTGRQDVLLRSASAVVCGGGHGMLAKTLTAGVPAVTVPGGGDQWELANRAARQGGSVLVSPPDAQALARALHRVLREPSFRRAARRAAASADAVRDPVAVCRSVLAGHE
ncbi:glycosyltransferase [Rhodococcoides corynebacterioides]|uniref:glycosyltransferase n=1 Tax=Rhodococcoides corynebacterioides TaxID=53972 RepID=UPI003F7D3540